LGKTRYLYDSRPRPSAQHPLNDLQAHRLLDTTLIVVNSDFDGGGGCGHQGSTFIVVLDGGGLKHHGAWGVTDDECKKPVENSCSVPYLGVVKAEANNRELENTGLARPPVSGTFCAL
jgi:hypothetical protein